MITRELPSGPGEVPEAFQVQAGSNFDRGTLDSGSGEEHGLQEQRILDAAMAILDQGVQFLETLDPEQYSRPVPVVFHATMGGHCRHSLDHFTCVLRSWRTGRVDYDSRDRDRRIEVDRLVALEVIRGLRGEVRDLSVVELRAPLRVRCEVSYGAGEVPETVSTLGRELVYSIVHAIHHYALMAVMGRLLGITMPDRFGMAPSTLAHLKRQGLS